LCSIRARPCVTITCFSCKNPRTLLELELRYSIEDSLRSQTETKRNLTQDIPLLRDVYTGSHMIQICPKVSC
jgi:hypothetical protein